MVMDSTCGLSKKQTMRVIAALVFLACWAGICGRCDAFSIPSAPSSASAAGSSSSGMASDDDIQQHQVQVEVGKNTDGKFSYPGTSASESADGSRTGPASGGDDGRDDDELEQTKRLLLEYLDQGGDPWEIPEDPRLILISELGLQQTTSGGSLPRVEGAGVERHSFHRAPTGVAPYHVLDSDYSADKKVPISLPRYRTSSQYRDLLREAKRKRDSDDAGPSLSVVNHLDVLRQKLFLEMARRRMQKSQSQIIANQNLLRQIGKRSVRPDRRNTVIHRTFDHTAAAGRDKHLP